MTNVHLLPTANDWQLVQGASPRRRAETLIGGYLASYANALRVIEGAVCSQEGCVGGFMSGEPDERGYSYAKPCPKCSSEVA